MIIFFSVYELDTWSRDSNSNFTLKYCLFAGTKVAKNADLDKYVYNGYGIGFDSRSKLALPDCSVGKNDITVGVDMSSFVHIDYKKKEMFIVDKVPTQGLDDTKLTAEAQYLFYFSRSNRKFCLRLHYHGSKSFLFVTATKIFQFKAKNSEIKKISFLFWKYFGRFFR